MIMFMGKPLEYWLALEEHVKNHNEEDLIVANARLRTLVACYEDLLDRANNFREKVKSL